MKNANMPAMPVSARKVYEIHTNDADGYTSASAGLTKREYFAGLAMQGLTTACGEDGQWSHNPEIAADAAVAYADALLAELEKAQWPARSPT